MSKPVIVGEAMIVEDDENKGEWYFEFTLLGHGFDSKEKATASVKALAEKLGIEVEF